ncbi:MAG: guanylyltransferase [Methanobacterium sp.]|uniref:tRNA(His) guanylyltransferase Thg1 family protein n=1 Tax=Methanobacterium sp. TaxID=2164 RepID=UPI003D661F58|nr:guanylyltransferase [Methanobacterium sp.]
MKEYEIFSNLKVPGGSKIILRIDGRKFSILSHHLGFKKPYDEQFRDFMIQSCLDFFKEFSPSFIYTFSDEINILLSEIPFAGRIEKFDSVFASFIAGSFTKNVLNAGKSIKNPISFDSRVIPLSSALVIEYFKERQNEAWRNCINGYSYWTLREEYTKEESMEILKNKKSSELHDILFKRGINLAELPSWQRRGVGIYKKEVIIQGYNPIKKENVKSKRKKLLVDCNLPIFDAQFFSENLILE